MRVGLLELGDLAVHGFDGVEAELGLHADSLLAHALSRGVERLELLADGAALVLWRVGNAESGQYRVSNGR